VRLLWDWVERHRIGELADIEPVHVAAYMEALQETASKPTVKQHLAAIRMLFDWLIIGQVLAVNPAHAVRGPKHVEVSMLASSRRAWSSVSTGVLPRLTRRFWDCAIAP
jgi:site-specific recombinase XerD